MTKPKSLVHAVAELKSLRETYTEMQREHTKKRNQDGKQMSMTMDRIRFLNTWIKAETDGHPFPCRNCIVAEGVYRMVREGKTVDEIKEAVHKAAFGDSRELIDCRMRGAI